MQRCWILDSYTFKDIFCNYVLSLQKRALMEQIAHQALVMQFIIEMARSGNVDPRGCFRLFFQKAKVSQNLYITEKNSWYPYKGSVFWGRLEVKCYWLNQAYREVLFCWQFILGLMFCVILILKMEVPWILVRPEGKQNIVWELQECGIMKHHLNYIGKCECVRVILLICNMNVSKDWVSYFVCLHASLCSSWQGLICSLFLFSQW